MHQQQNTSQRQFCKNQLNLKHTKSVSTDGRTILNHQYNARVMIAKSLILISKLSLETLCPQLPIVNGDDDQELSKYFNCVFKLNIFGWFFPFKDTAFRSTGWLVDLYFLALVQTCSWIYAAYLINICFWFVSHRPTD